MADNILVTPGAGATIAADEIAGALHQRVKITVGADGTNDGDVSSANPMPVDLGTNNDVTLAVLPDTAAGDLAAMVVDLAAIEVTQGTIAGDTTSIDGKITACNTGAVVVSSGTITAVTSITNPVTVDLGANNDVTMAVLPDTAAGDLAAMVVDLAAIEVTQGTIAGDTTSIDGKITACDTTGLALEAGGNLADIATDTGTIASDTTTIAGDTTSIDGKITACNTGAVVLTNDSIIGAGDPTIDSYASAAVNVATGADNSIVAAPGASKQIWVYGLILTADVAGSFSLQDEDNTALSGVMPIGATGGFVINPSGNFSMPWIKVATNKALEIDCVTCTADGIITYAIVSV